MNFHPKKTGSPSILQSPPAKLVALRFSTQVLHPDVYIPEMMGRPWRSSHHRSLYFFVSPGCLNKWQPSGNQPWQWTIPHLQMSIPLKLHVYRILNCYVWLTEGNVSQIRGIPYITSYVHPSVPVVVKIYREKESDWLKSSGNCTLINLKSTSFPYISIHVHSYISWGPSGISLTSSVCSVMENSKRLSIL